MNSNNILEYNQILIQLAEHALSEAVKNQCLNLAPTLNEKEVKRRLKETTQAKRIIEQTGTPPLASMQDLHKVLGLLESDAMLVPEQIAYILNFLVTCRRMKSYLKKAESTGSFVAYFGDSISDLSELEAEIERCIRNGQVEDRASDQLAGIRRHIENTSSQIKVRLDTLLRKNRDWFSESFVAMRNNRYTLPVKREHKNDVAGTLIDISQSGSTCFIEPAAVNKLYNELSVLHVEEDNEVRRILYTLTALIADYLSLIKSNMEAMETLDFLFAKAKLSISMKASPVTVTSDRKIIIINARHPLLNPDAAVPLNFELGRETSGIIITGPNTGGKTVALKTVGLLSLMAQSGLHVPADERSSFCMHNMVVCDIGDGQSITENLSTFSSHMKNVIEILDISDNESLILLDELGSGTDPAEGMGLAVAILEELCAKGCLFVATTHYPEIKEYAANKPGLINARMAFDRQSLMPLYCLEIGAAGESCALHIAERLGMPPRILVRAQKAAYSGKGQQYEYTSAMKFENDKNANEVVKRSTPQIIRQKESQPAIQPRSEKFNIGDSVMVYPQKEIGIVYTRTNEKGEIGVQVKGKKRLINHKRIKLKVATSELYPDGYDFSIIFDSVATRKARHTMERKHEEGTVIMIENEPK